MTTPQNPGPVRASARRRPWLRYAFLVALIVIAGAAWSARPGAQRNAHWQVGQLRPNGLRIVPSGSFTAAAVLNPASFPDPQVRHAYSIATQIPATLNQLYCWCGCENSGFHRSNLQCFEDQMAASCDVCQGTAEIAYRMTQQGITNPGRIQAAVDARWAPPGSRPPKWS